VIVKLEKNISKTQIPKAWLNLASVVMAITITPFMNVQFVDLNGVHMNKKILLEKQYLKNGMKRSCQIISNTATNSRFKQLLSLGFSIMLFFKSIFSTLIITSEQSTQLKVKHLRDLA
jgi:hypothetical protein